MKSKDPAAAAKPTIQVIERMFALIDGRWQAPTHFTK